jgi:hypothetical protein
LQSENGGDKPKYETIEAFKEVLFRERRAIDEENFAEAEGQAFAVTQISEVSTLLLVDLRDWQVVR